MKKLISMLLVGAMCLTFSGCFMSRNTIATINGEKVTQEMFWFVLTMTKSDIAQQAGNDSTEFWASGQFEGENPTEYAKKLTMDKIIRSFVLRQEAEKVGLKLDEEDKAQIENTRTSNVESLGGEEAYQKELASYKSNQATHAQVLADSMLGEKYYKQVRDAFTDTELKTYYETEMYRIKHILLNNTNSETGEKLSESELATVLATANDLAQRARGGEDFDAMVVQYSEDPGSLTEVDGYLMHKNAGMVKPFLDKANEMQIGDVSDPVETTYGYHVLKKYAVMPEKYQENIESIRGAYWNKKVDELTQNAEVVYNNSVYNSIKLEGKI